MARGKRSAPANQAPQAPAARLMAPVGAVAAAFCSGISLVFLVAFASVYAQFPGLYGSAGLLPIVPFLENTYQPYADRPLLFKLKNFFTLAWVAGPLGEHVDTVMELSLLVGMAASLAAFCIPWARNKITFLLLWLLYLSLLNVGQSFLHFQWDSLLMEAGFLAILTAPLMSYGPSHTSGGPRIQLFLVQWLFFRLMYLSGIVKLTSQCPTWWGLTALNYHYETQCIPTPAAWFAHQLPEWLQALSVVLTFVIEIALPFCVFLPGSLLPKLAGYSVMLLMALIMVTGNYTFFNGLTVVISLALFSDNDLGRRAARRRLGRAGWALEWLLLAVVVGALAAAAGHYFGLDVVVNGWESRVDSVVRFSKAEFGQFVSISMLAGIGVGAAALIWAIVYTLLEGPHTLARITTTIFTAALALFIFTASLVPMVKYNDPSNPLLQDKTVFPAAQEAYGLVHRYPIVHSYGLFRSMTGVGGRPEVAVEGSNSEDGPWQEYRFAYKPDQLDKRPPIVAPHQPRLDWQMWFAALGSYQRETWLVHLAVKLLEGEPAVLDLMGQEGQPFESPPKYIRLSLYTYHFTGHNAAKEPRDWWRRTFKERYMPTISLDQQQVRTAMAQLGFANLEKRSSAQCDASLVCRAVRAAREAELQLGSDLAFVWAMVAVALAARAGAAFLSRA